MQFPIQRLLLRVTWNGKVRDRDVNFTALRPLMYRIREMVYRTGLFLLIRLLAQKAKHWAPYFLMV